jgi:hypothetical protein
MVILRETSLTVRYDFLYEYTGDVLPMTTPDGRLRKYAKEGLKHFYIMVLDSVSE